MAHLLKRIFENDKKQLRIYGKKADQIDALSEKMGITS